MKAVEIGDACPHQGSFEACGLGDRPRRHEAPIAPAHDANSFAIHQALLDQVINAMHHVLEIFAAHITYHRAGKGCAMSKAAAYIGLEYSKAGRCQQL